MRQRAGVFGLSLLAGAVLLTSCAQLPAPEPAIVTSTEPSGPRNPSPDSVPACANRTIPPEEYERLLAAYIERRRAEAEARGNQPRPPLAPATQAVQIREGAMPKHDCFVEVARRGEIDLLFVGDSITDFFGRGDRGQAVWLDYYGDRNAANFGISGDTTQDVLWRLTNGELEGFEARAVVVMIGTNNIGRNENADIADGIGAILQEIRERQPQAKILLLGIFPRGGPGTDGRLAVEDINSMIERYADGETVFYQDVAPAFLEENGDFREGIMADPVHPATGGYEAWAATIEPMVAQLLSE